jgi:hypothetical protein
LFSIELPVLLLPEPQITRFATYREHSASEMPKLLAICHFRLTERRKTLVFRTLPLVGQKRADFALKNHPTNHDGMMHCAETMFLMFSDIMFLRRYLRFVAKL